MPSAIKLGTNIEVLRPDIRVLVEATIAFPVVAGLVVASLGSKSSLRVQNLRTSKVSPLAALRVAPLRSIVSVLLLLVVITNHCPLSVPLVNLA